MHLETILTFHKQVWREESHCGFRKPEGYHTAPDHDEANVQQDHHHLLWGRWFRMKLLLSSMESTWIVCGQLTPESVVNAWKGKCQNSTFLSFPWPMSFYFFRNFPPPIHLPPPPPSRSACEVLNLALRTFFYYQLFKCNKRLMPYFHATSIEWVSVCHNQFFCKLIRTVAVSPLAVSPLLKWRNAQFENKLISRRRKKSSTPQQQHLRNSPHQHHLWHSARGWCSFEARKSPTSLCSERTQSAHQLALHWTKTKELQSVTFIVCFSLILSCYISHVSTVRLFESGEYTI